MHFQKYTHDYFKGFTIKNSNNLKSTVKFYLGSHIKNVNLLIFNFVLYFKISSVFNDNILQGINNNHKKKLFELNGIINIIYLNINLI